MRHLITAFIALPFFLSACRHAQAVDEKPERLETTRSSQRGWLGVSTQDMTRRLAKSMDVKTEKGALVSDVIEDSPAEEAGVKEEDIIVEFNGKPIENADDLIQSVRKEKPGTAVSLVVVRKGDRKTLTATLDKAPRGARSFSFTVPPVPKIQGNLFRGDGLGLSLMQLDGQLGDYFEVPDGRGVLVKSVKAKSNAEKAGFKAGDVIVSIGKKSVTRVEDIRRALRKYDEGDKVDCEVLRKGKHITLNVEVPEMDDFHGFYYHFEPRSDLPEDLDLDIELEGLDQLRMDRHHLDREMDILKQNLKKMGQSIRDHVIKLRDELRWKLKEATNS